jgi:group I intron endonuclease
MNNCGIYSIYFKEIDNKYYIGCSVDITRRIQEHIYKLSNNKHTNYRLQKEYNDGSTPIFSIIEETTVDQLYKQEEFWIKEFDSFNNGFNLTAGGTGTGHGSEHPSAKHAKAVYISVLRELVYTNKSSHTISKELGVSFDTVRKIAGLKTHIYLKEEFPIEYSVLENKLGSRPVGRSAKERGVEYPKLISPLGEVFSVENTTQFAKQHKLNQAALHCLLTGKQNRKSHLGWKLYNESIYIL